MLFQKKRDENYRERWGYSFQWTDEHLKKPELEKLRQEFDEAAQVALERIQEVAAAKKVESGDKSPCPAKADNFALLQKYYREDETLSNFWKEITTIPEWVNWDQIDRGQRFYARYAVANSTGFAFQAFLRDNTASPGMAEVFARTGGYGCNNLLSRIFENITWTVMATRSLESIQPGGEGFAATIRVRLLHASVRQRIMKLANSRPEYFDAMKHGIPINDLDAIHSIAFFCCMPMWDSMPKMGVYPTKQEIADYIAFFRYIAYLMGVPTEYWSSPEKAKKVMETMYVHELDPSKTSRTLAHNFYKWLSDAPPVYLSKEFLEATCRWINGHEISDALGLGRPGLYYYLVFAGHNAICIWLAYSQRVFPAFDDFMIRLNRKNMYKAVTERSYLAGGASPFDFKFVPQLSQIMGLEPNVSELQSGKKFFRPVEWFLFMAFVMSCFAVLAFVAGSVKAVMVLSHVNWPVVARKGLQRAWEMYLE